MKMDHGLFACVNMCNLVLLFWSCVGPDWPKMYLWAYTQQMKEREIIKGVILIRIWKICNHANFNFSKIIFYCLVILCSYALLKGEWLMPGHICTVAHKHLRRNWLAHMGQVGVTFLTNSTLSQISKHLFQITVFRSVNVRVPNNSCILSTKNFLRTIPHRW